MVKRLRGQSAGLRALLSPLFLSPLLSALAFISSLLSQSPLLSVTDPPWQKKITMLFSRRFFAVLPPPLSFSPATRMQELQLQSFVLPEWQEAFGESLENAEEREERDSGESISSPNSATICSNCLLIPVDSPGLPW